MSKFAEKSDTELQKELKEKREAIREHEFAVAGAKEHSPHEIKRMKKDVARILTELNSRKE